MGCNMKLYVRASVSSYSNSIKYDEPGNMGSGPIYWKSRRGDRIVELLESFSESLESDPRIESWEILAHSGDVNIRIKTSDGGDRPYWSFKYSSLRSDNDMNLLWLKKGLNRILY